MFGLPQIKSGMAALWAFAGLMIGVIIAWFVGWFFLDVIVRMTALPTGIVYVLWIGLMIIAGSLAVAATPQAMYWKIFDAFVAVGLFLVFLVTLFWQSFAIFGL